MPSWTNLIKEPGATLFLSAPRNRMSTCVVPWGKWMGVWEVSVKGLIRVDGIAYLVDRRCFITYKDSATKRKRNDDMEIQGSDFQAGEVVFVDYGTGEPFMGRRTFTGRRLSAAGAAALNAGDRPVVSGSMFDECWDRVSFVERPPGKVHYFSECGSMEGNLSLSRSVQDTNCKNCLLKRARELSGWRWDQEDNSEAVTYLKAELGDKVADFANWGKEVEMPNWVKALRMRRAETIAKIVGAELAEATFVAELAHSNE